MIDATIIYYTHNREKPEFERKIQQSIRENSNGLPIISVSQKPIDFGFNICVGEVGSSGHNAFRQMSIGAKTARTKFIITAESDCLYPEEYFRFEPERDDIPYIARPTWVCFCKSRWVRFYAKKWRGDSNAMVVGRLFLLERLQKVLTQAVNTMWGPVGVPICALKDNPFEYFNLKTPILTFKTDRNMHKKTTYREDSKTRYLEPFGEVHDLIGRYNP